MNLPLHHGTLLKKGGVLGKWKARTFVLTRQGLLVSCSDKEWQAYMASAGDGPLPGKAYLQLGSDSAVMTPRSPPAPLLAIELVTRDPESKTRKKCVLCAQDKTEFKQWLAKLRGWLDASPASPRSSAATAAVIAEARARPRSSIFANVRQRRQSGAAAKSGAGDAADDDSVLTRQELLAISAHDGELPNLIGIRYHEIEMPMWTVDPGRAAEALAMKRLSVREAGRALLMDAITGVAKEWKASLVGGDEPRHIVLACDEATERTVRTLLDVRVDFAALGIEQRIDRVDRDRPPEHAYGATTCVFLFLDPLERVDAASCAAAAGAAKSEDDGMVPVLDLLAADGDASPLAGCGKCALFLSQGCDDVENVLAVCSTSQQLLRLLKARPDAEEAGVATIISLNFLASGEQLITFSPPARHPHDFAKFFGPLGPTLAEEIAAKLVPVCAALHEYPNIRFCSESPLTGLVAMYLGDPDPTLGHLTPFVRANSKFWYNGMATTSLRATLLIVDRTFDTVSPCTFDCRVDSLVADALGQVDIHNAGAAARTAAKAKSAAGGVRKDHGNRACTANVRGDRLTRILELVQSVVEPCVGENDAARVVQMTEQWCNLWSGLRVGSDDGRSDDARRGSSGLGGGGAAAARGGGATKTGRQGGASESDELSDWMGKLRSLPLGALFESEDRSISMSEASSSFADDAPGPAGAGDEDRWGDIYPMTHYYDLARAACAIDFGLPHGHSDTHDPADRSSQQVLALLVKLLEFQSTLFAPEHRSWASGWTERKGGEHKAMCVRHLDEILNDDAVASHDATKLRLLSLFFLRFPTEALEHQNEMLYTLADLPKHLGAAVQRLRLFESSMLDTHPLFANETTRRATPRRGLFSSMRRKKADSLTGGSRLLTRAPENEHTLRLATLVKRALMDTLDEGLFPYQVPPARGMRMDGAAPKKGKPVVAPGGGELCGARLMLFVIGGVTAAEVREARKMGAKYGRQVIVISTALISFAHYIEGVSRLQR